MRRPPSTGFDAHCFLLAPGCYLVRGARRGALYDLKGGNVFSIDGPSARILEACETGRDLAGVAAEVGEADPRELAALLQPVADAGLGDFHPLPAPFVEKVQPVLTDDQQRRRRQPTPVSYAFIELTGACDLDCAFCVPGDPTVRRRTGCGRWADGGGAAGLDEQEWLGVIDDLVRLRCPAVHFMGGEPLLAGDLLTVLIARLRRRGIPGVYLSTNTLALDAASIDLLARHGVQVVVQVFTHRPEVHDRITGRPGSHTRLMSRLAALHRAGVATAFNLVLTGETVGDREETLRSLAPFQPRRISTDAVRPAPGETVDPALVPHLFRCRPQFAPTGPEAFFQRRHGHSCWLGKLAVTATGDVLPCTVARSERIGNVREKSLKEMYRDGDFDPWWRLTIDQVDGCRSCELRYACFDCRPLIACAAGGRRTARDPFCTYDPSAGEWRQPHRIAETRDLDAAGSMVPGP